MSKRPNTREEHVIESEPLDGSATPFREIVDRHKEQVYALALDLLGNKHDAQDLTQDVFIKMYRGFDKYRGDAQMSTWLYRITVNTYLNRRRRNKPTVALDSVLEGPRDDEPSPEQATSMALLQAYIDAALTRLSPKERTAFVLRHYHDKSVPEIGAAMGIAQGTIKSLLFRATTKMRSALAPVRDELANA